MARRFSGLDRMKLDSRGLLDHRPNWVLTSPWVYYLYVLPVGECSHVAPLP